MTAPRPRSRIRRNQVEVQPRDAVELRVLIRPGKSGILEVDGQSFRTYPQLRREEMEECVLAMERWSKGLARSIRFDKAAAPRVADVIETAGAKLVDTAVGSVMNRIFNRKTE